MGSHRPGWNFGTNMGRMAFSGHLGSIQKSAYGNMKVVFIFVSRRGDFHGRMAVCRNAALGRAGSLFIGPLSLALIEIGLYLRDHFLLKSFKTSLAPTAMCLLFPMSHHHKTSIQRGTSIHHLRTFPSWRSFGLHTLLLYLGLPPRK